MPGIAVNLDAARVDALSQDLADALEPSSIVEAVGGLEVRRRLPAEGIPPDCVATPACTADVAKRVAATQLLFVVMVDTGSGGSVQIDTTWVDPATGKSASRSCDRHRIAHRREGAVHRRGADRCSPTLPVRPKPTDRRRIGGIQTTMTDAVPRHFTTPAKITAAVAVVGLGARHRLRPGDAVAATTIATTDRIACSDERSRLDP